MAAASFPPFLVADPEGQVPHASFQLPEQTFTVQPPRCSPKLWDHMHPTQIFPHRSPFSTGKHTVLGRGQPGSSCREIANHRHQTIEKTDKAWKEEEMRGVSLPSSRPATHGQAVMLHPR